jgi:hypothetical protein
MNWSAEQAMNVLKIPEEEKEVSKYMNEVRRRN